MSNILTAERIRQIETEVAERYKIAPLSEVIESHEALRAELERDEEAKSIIRRASELLKPKVEEQESLLRRLEAAERVCILAMEIPLDISLEFDMDELLDRWEEAKK